MSNVTKGRGNPSTSNGPNQGQAILSIVNNDFHPLLNAQGAQEFIEAKQLLDAALVEIQAAYSILRHFEIELQEVRTACHLVSAVNHIVNETLEQSKNRRAVAYAESRGEQ